MRPTTIRHFLQAVDALADTWILTKTARTFVQDGASTEFATQILGTTLDNGRLYAKILSTSSRVFYDKDSIPDGSSPFVVYPSKIRADDIIPISNLDDEPIRIVETISKNINAIEETTARDDINEVRENDVFSKREDEEHLKPARVRSDNLPTYTVKQDYVVKASDIILDDDQSKSLHPRVPKVFKPPLKVSPKKQETKPLSTVTYHGFADFTTTVGDTVIVFSPSTAPAPVGRPATTIKGDATLHPNDGIAVLRIKPTNVLPGSRKTQSLPSKNLNLGNEINRKNSKPAQGLSVTDLQPSTTNQPEVENSGEMTKPLLLVSVDKTGSQNPTGLIKVVDSTTASKGTTTHYMSSIYGTYIGTNYAQIVHTASNVYFFPEESTSGYDGDTTTNTDDSTETTESATTTMKDTITTESTTENELGNDIVPQNQGRSIKGSSPKNQFFQPKGQRQRNSEVKPSLASKLIPSTIYKTFTYFTTFFIPGKGRTSTSIRSREVVSSEVTHIAGDISPTSTQSQSIVPTEQPSKSRNKVEVSSNTDMIENSNSSDKQEVEEIQLIFKTIFTTFTYLTTFYDDSTTSVSSRKVTATNVITQTIDPMNSLIDVDSLIDKEVSSFIKPTKTSEPSSQTPMTKYNDSQKSKQLYETTEDESDASTTTSSDHVTTTEEGTTLESTTEQEINDSNPILSLEPSRIPAETAILSSERFKTYYTTFTYFTTIIVDDETEIETRTEVSSNVVTETIEATSVSQALEKSESPTVPSPSSVPPEIQAYINALAQKKSEDEARLLAKKVQKQVQTTTEEENDVTTEDSSTYPMPDETTIFEDIGISEKLSSDGEVVGSMKTDVIFSSSSGGSTVLDVAEKRNGLPEDQELSETNHQDVEPAPTLLLQTSYTTYTYFTTMYNGDATDVLSRLKTVTNVVTETIRPTVVVPPEPKTVQPLTYFTTFTYWTTFIKGDETATTSREETVSNIITPGVTETPSLQLDVIKTYRPFILATPVHTNSIETRESKATSDNEITSQNVILKEIPTVKANDVIPTISPDPITLYTTYTYFTTSYIGNSTLLNSRLETVTSVSYPDDLVVRATPRAIGGAASSINALDTVEKQIQTSKVSNLVETGLLSTVRRSQVDDGTTTHFMTDVYGTYIDGLYAQVVETSTSVELPSPIYSSAPTPVLPTGVLSLNKGSIIDADEITTVFYTTKQIGTTLNGLYVTVIESTSSTKIDEDKLQTKPPQPGHRTGLVRLIKGHIEANDSTTFYQSKVIGTSIDGRYAQIIESTSSFVLPKTSSIHRINPSATLPPHHATGAPGIAPSPAAIQPSTSDDHGDASNDSEQDESENEDEDEDQKGKKKSRLTFSSRKRTSSANTFRPFASRTRPTFNPKRKPQGATTITRSDITPTITATLAGKGSKFASSRGRTSISSSTPPSSISSSRRFSGRRTPVASSPVASSTTNHPAGSTRVRGSIRATASSTFSGSRRGSTPIRGSSARPALRSSSSISPSSSTRYRVGVRPSSILLKNQLNLKQEDQNDSTNEFTTTTLVTEETIIPQGDSENEAAPTVPQTTTESARRANNPLLRFRRPNDFGSSSPRSTAARSTTTSAPTTKRSTNSSRQNTVSRNPNKVKPTVTPATIKPRQGQSNLFPPRRLPGKKSETTESTVEDKTEVPENGNLQDEPVAEISDNDYEGSERSDSGASPRPEVTSPTTPIRPFTRISRGRRVRRQTNQQWQIQSRSRRPIAQVSYVEERLDNDYFPSQEDYYSRTSVDDARYGVRGRSAGSYPRSSPKDYQSSEDDVESYNPPSPRSRSKSTPSRSSPRPTPVTPPSRQFTLREAPTPAKPINKRPVTTTRNTQTRTRGTVRARTGTNRYQDTSNSRRSSSRVPTRSGTRTTNRRVIPTRGRYNSREDYRDVDEFDGTITVTHYVPTEVTVPVVNNGVTERKNIITAQPSKEVIGPHRYRTITNSDGRELVVLTNEMTGTNFQGFVEVTKFVIHETPTTKVSHTLTSSGGRKFSQAVVVPSTIYSIENVVSTIRPSIADSSPLANILLSQLLLGQLGQQNPLMPNVPAPAATPSTRYETRATTYVTTITKHQSTVIPLTFRGKEILTTLVDTSSDVVTATEFITDTVVVTPTATLPAPNLNSILLLLQQQQTLQQTSASMDPLLAAAPLLTQSNTLPGESERRDQPVDFDYKPESYEDSSDEESEKTQKVSQKPSPQKTDGSGSLESSVITLYVSGRRPGEFSTVLSTVKVGEDSSSTKTKRHATEGIITASLSPSLQSGSYPAVQTLTGSEEQADVHKPTQSLESVLGDYRTDIDPEKFDEDNIKQKTIGISGANYQYPGYEPTFYGDAQEDHYRQSMDYDTYREDDAAKKTVRVRVPVIRSRSIKEHAVTVVRRRPLVTYSTSLTTSPLQEFHSPTSHRVVTRTRIRNIDSVTLDNSGGYETHGEDVHSAKPKVTVTRRRKIVPTATPSFNQRERVTRKKLVKVRPIPQPSPTIAIITTGFYTAPSFEQDDYYYDAIESALPTPDFEAPLFIESQSNTGKYDQSKISDAEMSRIEEPIIITDNFFFPVDRGQIGTTEDTEISDDGIGSTTDSPSPVTTDIGIRDEVVTEKDGITPYKDIEYAQPENRKKTTGNDDNLRYEIFTENPASSREPTVHPHHLSEAEEISRVNETIEGIIRATPVKTVDTSSEPRPDEDLKVIPIRNQSIITKGSEEKIMSRLNHTLESSEIPTVIPLGGESSDRTNQDSTVSDSHITSPVRSSSSFDDDVKAKSTPGFYLTSSRPDTVELESSKATVDQATESIQTKPEPQTTLQLANGNHLPETRHKVTSNLADGIPISPGEIITANSDVIIGKPAKLGPRPPQTFEKDGNIGMKPPPVPVPNIPVHPVLEVIEREPSKPIAQIQRGSQKLEVYQAQQIYEDHIKVPEPHNQPILQNHYHSHQTSINPPQNRISSKQDILEHDPLLIPPSVVTKPNVELKNRHSDKGRHPWSAKDPITASNIFNEERYQFSHHNKDSGGFESISNSDELRKKSQVPEPIVHQVPHVIDRSTGQPLLVNIQPSQVANVVIPEGGTQALIFGDTSEPHKSGQYFDDPSPYPEPEVGPGFIGIHKETSGNEIHRVLSGGILGAPSVPIRPPKVHCIPECKASKSEICAESSGEMQCICRPGFSRDFPGKPCDPTYTFTIGLGLDRIGRDRFTYDPDKNDTNLALFRRHTDKIKDALYYTVMRTGFRDAYRGVKITKFSSDPAKVLFNLQLSSNTDEAKLKDTIRKYLVESNYTLPGNDIIASKDLGMVEVEDFNECTAESGGPYHDCSPQAACINLKGTYQCSCKEGWADISENTAYPGRVCSQAALGCTACNNKGHCLVNTYGQEVCECFPWYSGKKCQINMKVLLFALVTMGIILLGLLAVCLGVACLRNPNRRRRSADRRAMISGMGGDTSSEGSVAELAIPHHVPHILPPPPQMVAPAPPIKKMPRKVGGKTRRAPKKPAPVVAPVQISSSCPANEQRDRSLTVMIPRAKYRSGPQSATPQNFKTMSTFAVDEHKLIDYLDGGAHPSNRKPSFVSASDFKESEHRISKQHPNFTPTGALVSAGFQVSATVTRPMDAESTLARSCGETTVEPSTKIIRSGSRADFGVMELDSTLARSCAEATIHASTKQQLLRLELADAGSTLARSCGETTIQPPTKVMGGEHRRNGAASDCQARDSASEGHTMAERDLGSTLRLPAQHASLYNQDR
ncbi:hypothetical protein QAD02_010986, partial [Eretmocerus hayati]